MGQAKCLASGIISRTTGPAGGLFVAAAAVVLKKDFGCCVQIARIALIGIDVDLQLGCFVCANEHIVERYAAVGTADLQLHHVSIAHAVGLSVCEIHVHVSSCPDHTAFQLDRTGGAD